MSGSPNIQFSVRANGLSGGSQRVNVTYHPSGYAIASSPFALNVITAAVKCERYRVVARDTINCWIESVGGASLSTAHFQTGFFSTLQYAPTGANNDGNCPGDLAACRTDVGAGASPRPTFAFSSASRSANVSITFGSPSVVAETTLYVRWATAYLSTAGALLKPYISTTVSVLKSRSPDNAAKWEPWRLFAQFSCRPTFNQGLDTEGARVNWNQWLNAPYNRTCLIEPEDFGHPYTKQGCEQCNIQSSAIPSVTDFNWTRDASWPAGLDPTSARNVSNGVEFTIQPFPLSPQSKFVFGIPWSSSVSPTGISTVTKVEYRIIDAAIIADQSCIPNTTILLGGFPTLEQCTILPGNGSASLSRKDFVFRSDDGKVSVDFLDNAPNVFFRLAPYGASVDRVYVKAGLPDFSGIPEPSRTVWNSSVRAIVFYNLQCTKNRIRSGGKTECNFRVQEGPSSPVLPMSAIVPPRIAFGPGYITNWGPNSADVGFSSSTDKSFVFCNSTEGGSGCYTSYNFTYNHNATSEFQAKIDLSFNFTGIDPRNTIFNYIEIVEILPGTVCSPAVLGVYLPFSTSAGTVSCSRAAVAFGANVVCKVASETGFQPLNPEDLSITVSVGQRMDVFKDWGANTINAMLRAPMGPEFGANLSVDFRYAMTNAFVQNVTGTVAIPVQRFISYCNSTVNGRCRVARTRQTTMSVSRSPLVVSASATATVTCSVTYPDFARYSTDCPLSPLGNTFSIGVLGLSLVPFGFGITPTLRVTAPTDVHDSMWFAPPLIVDMPVDVVDWVWSSFTCADANGNRRLAVGAPRNCTLQIAPGSAQAYGSDFVVDQTSSASSGPMSFSGPYVQGNSFAWFTAVVPSLSQLTAATATLGLRWSAALDNQPSLSSTGSLFLLGVTNITCTPTRQIRRTVTCMLQRAANSTNLAPTDFDTPTTDYPPAVVGNLTETADGSLQFTVSNLDNATGNVTISARFSAAVGGIAVAPFILIPGLNASLSCETYAITFREKIRCNVSREGFSQQFSSADFTLLTPGTNGSINVSSPVNVGWSSTDRTVFYFTVHALSPAGEVVVRAQWKESLGGRALDVKISISTVYNLTCPVKRLWVGERMNCSVVGSAAIDPTDFAVSLTQLSSSTNALRYGSPSLVGGIIVVPVIAAAGATAEGVIVRLVTPDLGVLALTPATVDVAGVGSLTCTPSATRLLYTTAASCTIGKAPAGTRIFASDLVLSSVGNVTALVETAAGGMSFTFRADRLYGDAGCNVSVASTITNATEIVTNFAVVSIASATCPSGRLGANTLSSCILTRENGSAPLRAIDVAPMTSRYVVAALDRAVQTADGGLRVPLVARRGQRRHLAATTGADAASYRLSWSTSVVDASVFGSPDMTDPVLIEVVDVIMSCVATRLRPGASTTCYLNATAISAPLAATGDVLPPSANQTGAAIAGWKLSSDGAGFSFTYTAPAALSITNMTDSITVRWDASIDPAMPPAQVVIVELVSATFSCATTRIRLGATSACTLAPSATSSALTTADFQSPTFSAGYASSAPLLVAGTSVTFAISGDVMGSGGTFSISYSSAIGGGVVTGSPSSAITVFALRTTSPLQCARGRMAVNSAVLCTLYKHASSPALQQSDFAELSSFFYSAVTATSSGLDFTYTPPWASGVGYQMTFSFSALVGGGFAASTPIDVIEAMVDCSGIRRAIGGTSTCTVKKGGASDWIVFSDLNAPVYTASLVSVTPFTVTSTGSIIFSSKALASTAGTTVSVSYSTAIGGGGGGSVVIEIVEAGISCPTRWNANTFMPCTINPVGSSGNLKISDIFAAIYTMGTASYFRRGSTATVLGTGLQINLPLPATPLPASTGKVIANYYGRNVGAWSPLRNISTQFSVLSANISCTELRRRRGAYFNCTLIPHATAAGLIVSDVALTTYLGSATVAAGSTAGTVSL
eukprot:tig00020964_g16807.t1